MTMTENTTPTANGGHRINDSAMLVNLSISQWRATRNDQNIADEVAKKHGNKSEMGQFKKSLIVPAHLQPLSKIAGAARVEHYRLTLPWTDEGFRILSSAGYFKYTQAMKKFEQDFWKEYNGTFKPMFTNYVKEARTALNGLFRATEYPGVTWDSTGEPRFTREDELDRKFAFSVSFGPVPDAQDFRVDLGDEETARIKTNIEGSVQATIQNAMQDVWRRLHDVVGAMVERLNAYKVTRNGVDHPFRDTLVSNIVDVLEVVPILNLTNDPKLDDFCRRIKEELTQYSPDTLRENARARTDTARRAEEILDKMQSFLG